MTIKTAKGLAAASALIAVSAWSSPAFPCEIPEGGSNLAGAYFAKGVMTEESAERAECIRKAAERGHRGAQVALANLYYKGNGVPKDAGQAAFWYRRAASAGGTFDGRAALALARLYMAGEGVVRDLDEASKWVDLAIQRLDAYEQRIAALKKKAERGDTESQYRLGVKYLVGEMPVGAGTVVAIGQGIAWLRKAAIAGSNGALIFLASAHRVGHWGVPKNTNRAIQWYKVGAKRGDAGAQYALGEMYAKGEGVEQNYLVAYVWYNLAAASSEQPFRKLATLMRNAIEAALTPAERSKLQAISTAIWERDTPPTVPLPWKSNPDMREADFERQR